MTTIAQAFVEDARVGKGLGRGARLTYNRRIFEKAKELAGGAHPMSYKQVGQFAFCKMLVFSDLSLLLVYFESRCKPILFEAYVKN